MNHSVDFYQSSDSFFDHSHKRDSGGGLPSLKTPKRKPKGKAQAPGVDMQFLTKKDKQKLVQIDSAYNQQIKQLENIATKDKDAKLQQIIEQSVKRQKVNGLVQRLYLDAQEKVRARSKVKRESPKGFKVHTTPVGALFDPVVRSIT